MPAMDSGSFRYRFGSAEFDEARFELRVAGLPVEVERRALAVLAVLLRHAGEVVTKAELLAEVWAGRVTVEAVLPNAVNKLRRALGEANADVIVTVPRTGYRLDGLVTRIAVRLPPASPLQLAAGQPVPGRPNLRLVEPLAGSGEVWLAVHDKTGERRVYKFAQEGARLRALKREVTLLRLLRDSLPGARGFVEVLDWGFEQAPFFIECRYGGMPLSDWATRHLADIGQPGRVALFLQIARAVEQAHGVGVLHKDLKPGNVLVEGPADAPWVRLTDFGSGQVLEPDRLVQLDITRMGLTVQDAAASGTPLYLAPELFEGEMASVKSDVFALGVMLYQLLAGRVGLPMAPGWEAHVADPLLRDDIRAATDGDPARRIASAAELVDRLERLDARRQARVEQEQRDHAARRDREALAAARTRRPFVVALVAVLALSTAGALGLLWQANEARQAARVELARATALSRFVTEDLIGRANPLVSAKGPDASLREVLLSARAGMAARFAAQPDAGAAVHGSLAALFAAVDLHAEAEQEARQALALLEGSGRAHTADAVPALAAQVQALARLSRVDDARRALAGLEEAAAAAGFDAGVRQRLHAARSSVLIAHGDHRAAVAELRAALAQIDRNDPAQAAVHDALRLDLITMLSQAQLPQQAREEGRRLVAELEPRGPGAELVLALVRLALARAQEEDHAAAEALLLQAQPVIAARLGETHSRHITLLTELLAVNFRRGDWPRAARFAQQVHELALAKYGPAHLSVQTTLVNWGRTLLEAGQPRAALPKLRAGHAMLRQLTGPDSPRAQDAAFLVALALLETGDTAAAEALLPQLQPAVLESFRPTGQWQPAIGALRGLVLLQQGRAAAARPLLDVALGALHDEAALQAPSRLYRVVRDARAGLAR